MGSARTFATIVGLPGGATVNYDLRLSCSDSSVADNVTALVVEEKMEGAVGNLPPSWSIMSWDADGVGASYGFVTNYGSDPAFVPVAFVVLGVGVGNTTCTLKIGDSLTASVDVNFEDTLDEDGSQLFSTIEVEQVYVYDNDIYKGQSVAYELDITVPPWSGKEEMEITFQPQSLSNSLGVNHHWRMCRVDIVDVDTDLTCLAEGAAEYGDKAVSISYSKSDETDSAKWYDDIGTITIPRTCPSQINETGKHSFRARAFFENYPQDTGYWADSSVGNSATPKLSASLQFSNGSSWSSELNLDLLNTQFEGSSYWDIGVSIYVMS